MFYEKELEFFRKIIERMKIKTTIITKDSVPDDIDLGIRALLHFDDDYKQLFTIKTITNNKNEIIKINDSFLCNYIFIPLPDQDEKTALILGPYTQSIVTNSEIKERCDSYSLPTHIITQIEKYFSAITYISDDYILTSLISCLGETIFGSLDNFSVINKRLSESTEITLSSKLRLPEKTEDPLLAIRIMEQRYQAENDLIAAVSQGLNHKAEMVFGSISPSGALEARLPDNLRNMKNYLIICNTLLRKAAEQGSVHPIYIDSVSSEFALKIEGIQNSKDFDYMFNYMIQKYCRLVKKHSNKGYSLFVQRAITQIDADITSDLSLKKIAEVLKINPSYLSTLFKKETGVTLTDFVNKKRIEKAKQLLKTTNLQIQTIAQSCGMLDVNYFTKVFKKHTNQTPKEYRANII